MQFVYFANFRIPGWKVIIRLKCNHRFKRIKDARFNVYDHKDQSNPRVSKEQNKQLFVEQKSNKICFISLLLFINSGINNKSNVAGN